MHPKGEMKTKGKMQTGGKIQAADYRLFYANTNVISSMEC